MQLDVLAKEGQLCRWRRLGPLRIGEVHDATARSYEDDAVLHEGVGLRAIGTGLANLRENSIGSRDDAHIMGTAIRFRE